MQHNATCCRTSEKSRFYLQEKLRIWHHTLEEKRKKAPENAHQSAANNF